QPHRARAPRAVGGETRRAAAEDPARRRDFPRARELRGGRRLLRRTQSRAAYLAHGAGFIAARRVRLPKALERDPRLAQSGRAPRESGGRARARRRAGRACQVGRIPYQVALAAVPKTPEEINRAEIRALKAYHVPDSSGLVKLDAMENPY